MIRTDPRRAPRKSRRSQGVSNSVVVEVGAPRAVSPDQEVALMGYDKATLIHATSDLAGLDHFGMLATPAEWREFTAAVKRGEFDLDEDGLLPGTPVPDHVDEFLDDPSSGSRLTRS